MHPTFLLPVWSTIALVASVFSLRATPGLAEKPLAAHPHPRAKTLFVALPPEQTGIRAENNYRDPRMWSDLYQQFEGGSVGCGAAVGDYDGDGRPDIFVVAKSDSCRLFRNLGDFHFEDVTDRAGVGDRGDAALIWKQGATFADVNNDGRLDLYVCRFDAPNLLYINQGDGTFKEQAHAYGLDVRDASVMAAFCDYDRDGWLDAYIATNMLDPVAHPSGQHGHLLHNNRDGTFTEVTEHAGISGEAQSHSATWWDFDNDGWPDLYVANDYGAPDKLYRNRHDGTFVDVIDQVLPYTSFSSMGADVGDVNNDGLIDLCVADMAATTHEKDHHAFADGREKNEEIDRATRISKYRHNVLLLNTNTDGCLESGFLAGIAATDWTWSVRFEDLDNDGRLDLHVANGFLRDPSPDLYKRMLSANSPAERHRIMSGSPVLAEENLAYRNLGDLQFENVSAAWGLNQKGVSFGVATGDFAGDGNLDLVFTNYAAGPTFLRNDEDLGHRVMIDLRGTISNRFGVGALVKLESNSGVQVRQLWLARGYTSSSEPALHFGLGPDTKINRVTVTWPSGYVQTFADLSVDRRFTITEPENLSPAGLEGAAPSAPRGVPAATERRPPSEERPPTQFSDVSESIGLALRSREETVDELSQQRLLPLRLNARGPTLAAGVIESSGRQAIVIGGTTLDPRRVLQPDANHRYEATDQPALTVASEINDGPVLLFDADGDGFNDLLVTKGGNALPAGEPEYQPRLFLNDRHGQFRPAPEGTLPVLSISAGAAAAADFDHDGRVDLFIGARVLPGQYPFAPQSALLANRGGRFEEVTAQLARGLREVGMVTAALWSDVDGDGWADLVVTQDWGMVKYYHNDEGRGFSDRSAPAGFAAAGSGWWTSIASADFNGDGRPDYVVGNLGLNTPYRADSTHPAVLYAGEFKGDGSTQLVEAYFEGDKLYPWRTRQRLGASIPSILKRFPSNDAFARATLPEIFGPDQLAAARRFEVTELRSGVFLSNSDGTYRFEPLPRIVQISPVQSIAVADFDRDGNQDIYVVQNSYAPVPAVGHFAGGLSQLLLGDGHGQFTAVPPAKSGLVVPGSAKAVLAIDFDHDNWPDLLVTRSNDTNLAFHNTGVSKQP